MRTIVPRFPANLGRLVLQLVGLSLALAACTAQSDGSAEPGGLYVHSGAEIRDFVGGGSGSFR